MQMPSKIKLLQTIVFTLTLSMHLSAIAKPPPPGVSKKNVCQKTLVAVNKTDISFGNFDGSTSGNITVTAGGVRSTTGPVLLGGTVNPAAFDVSNPDPTCAYWPVRIQFQVLAILAGQRADMTDMTSSTYRSLPKGPFSLVGSNVQEVKIGATLNTGAQTSGFYTSSATPFTVRFSHVNP